MGECILYLWVEKVREFLVEASQSAETGKLWEKIIRGAHLAMGFTYRLGFYSLISAGMCSINIAYNLRQLENLPHAEDFR